MKHPRFALTANTRSWLLIVLALVFIVYQLFAIMDQNRYLAFGLDTVRILGQTNQMRQLHKLPDYTPGRLGFPLVAAIIANFLNLPASQSLVPMLYLNYVGGLAIMTFFAWFLTRDLRFAAFIALIQSTSILNQISPSNFMSYVLAPLRLIAVAMVFRPAYSKFRRGLFIVYLIITLLGNATYPITSFFIDGVIFLYACLHALKKRSNLFDLLVIVATNQLSLVLMYFLRSLAYNRFLTLPQFVDVAFTLTLGKLSPTVIAAIFVLLLVAQWLIILIMFIPSSWRWITRRLSRLRRSLSSLNAIIPPTLRFRPLLYLVLGLMLASPWLQTGLFGLAPALNRFIPQGMFNLALIGLVGVAIITRRLDFRSTPFLFTLASVSLIYYAAIAVLTPFPTFQKALSENRLYLVTSFWLVLVGFWSLAKINRRVLVLLVFLLFFKKFDASLYYLRHTFHDTGNTRLAATMDWFNLLPQHDRSLFYAPYFNFPGLAGHEKYQSLYYTASSVPWSSQRALGKIDPTGSRCYYEYFQYAYLHSIKYLVLEPDTKSICYQLLSTLGNIIRDDAVRIISLDPSFKDAARRDEYLPLFNQSE